MAGPQRKTLLDIGAWLCFVADLLSRNSASSTPRPTESARFRPANSVTLLLFGKAPFCSSTAHDAQGGQSERLEAALLAGLAFGLPPSGPLATPRLTESARPRYRPANCVTLLLPVLARMTSKEHALAKLKVSGTSLRTPCVQ